MTLPCGFIGPGFQPGRFLSLGGAKGRDLHKMP